ncbi:hypothetical protein PUN28_001360 [Cardiocondyla obscurior]|uniref:Uncharacterized protein n=1 Tax=Cardiocondyla obscurior TaxID=286306 RepID=A0AAW2H4X6_9HYME
MLFLKLEKKKRNNIQVKGKIKEKFYEDRVKISKSIVQRLVLIYTRSMWTRT